MVKLSEHDKQQAQKQMRGAADAALAKSQELTFEALKQEALGRKDLAQNLRGAANLARQESEHYDDAAEAIGAGDVDKYLQSRSRGDQMHDGVRSNEELLEAQVKYQDGVEDGTIKPPSRPEPEPTTPMTLPDDTEATAHARQEAARRAAERDKPEMSTEKEVDLDADQAAAVRAQATAAREAADAGYKAEAVRIAKLRDQAARDKWSDDQELKAAQMQVKGQQKVVDEARGEVARLNREADRVAKSDPPRAEFLREKAKNASTDQEVAEARLEDAKQVVEAASEVAQRQAAVLKDLENQQRDLQQQRGAAEKAVDGLEERARLLEQAQQKVAEADRTGNEKLRQEAEALVERAEKVHVDTAAIDEVSTPDPRGTSPVPPPGSEDEPPAGQPTGGSQTDEVPPQPGPVAPPAPPQPTTPKAPETLEERIARQDAEIAPARAHVDAAIAKSEADHASKMAALSAEREPYTKAEASIKTHRAAVDDVKTRIATQTQDLKDAEAVKDREYAATLRKQLKDTNTELQQHEQSLNEAMKQEVRLRPLARKVASEMEQSELEHAYRSNALSEASQELYEYEQQTADLKRYKQVTDELRKLEAEDPYNHRGGQAELQERAQRLRDDIDRRTIDREVIHKSVPGFPADAPGQPATQPEDGTESQVDGVSGASPANQDAHEAGEAEGSGAPEPGADEGSETEGSGAPEPGADEGSETEGSGAPEPGADDGSEPDGSGTPDAGAQVRPVVEEDLVGDEGGGADEYHVAVMDESAPAGAVSGDVHVHDGDEFGSGAVPSSDEPYDGTGGDLQSEVEPDSGTYYMDEQPAEPDETAATAAADDQEPAGGEMDPMLS